MTNTWTELLQQQAAIADETQDLANGSQLIPLSQLGVLHVTGDDAKGFLQNLVTNNVNALSSNQGQLAGLCNPKGRLLAIFMIVCRQDGFDLLVPKSMCAGLLQRLSMYILRSKVTITDVSADKACLGLITNTDSQDAVCTYPEQNFEAVDIRQDYVIKLPMVQGNRYLFVGNADQASSVANEALNQGWQLSSENYWELTDIVSGLAMIYPETREVFTTQQVNLDLVGGVSFNKGCYPGQEIVARLHYLGSPSRRMFIAEMNSDDVLEVGQDVLSEDNAVAGQVVRWVKGDDTRITMLLSLKLSNYQSALWLNGNAIKLLSETIPS